MHTDDTGYDSHTRFPARTEELLIHPVSLVTLDDHEPRLCRKYDWYTAEDLLKKWKKSKKRARKKGKKGKKGKKKK